MDQIVNIADAELFLGGRHILKSFNWQMQRGENWFVLGPNGAGKTTLIKMLLGHVWPKFGARVELLGERFGQCNLVELRKRIAWVSPFMQKWRDDNDLAVDIVMSGFDGTMAKLRTMTAQEEEQARMIMRQLDCEQLAEQAYATLSSGEQMKIFIARALVTSPDLMILDEACVHLDFKSREYFLNVIDRLIVSDDAPPIIFVTQRVEDISRAFSHGMIIRDGEILARGYRDDILTEELLSQAFATPISLHQAQDGRLWPLPRS